MNNPLALIVYFIEVYMNGSFWRDKLSSDSKVERIGFEDRAGRYAVTLPCEPSSFGEFVSKLLGKCQSISGGERGAFSIDRRDIENMYHLIDQRITQQNKAEIISFSVSIHYNDGTNITLNSYNNFITYTETKPLVVKGISLSWIYLITFNDTNAPEKQQIDLSFDTDPFLELPDDENIIMSISRSPMPSRIRRRREITYLIQHTNRSWGNDIQNLLSEHIRTYAKRLEGWRKFSTKYGYILGITIGILTFAISIYYAFKLSREYNDSLLRASQDIISKKASDLVLIKERLDLLTKMYLYQMDNSSGVFTSMFCLIALISSFIMAVVITFGMYYEEHSFILINKPSQDRKKEITSSTSNSFLKIVITLSASIGIGVAGNVAYYYFAKYVGMQ